MTADSTTRLREALAEVLLSSMDFRHYRHALGVADAILASLAEHRDDVLDVLGMPQGWQPQIAPTFICERRHRSVNVPQHDTCTAPIHDDGGLCVHVEGPCGRGGPCGADIMEVEVFVEDYDFLVSAATAPTPEANQ